MNLTDDKKLVAISMQKNLQKMKDLKEKHTREVKYRESIILVDRHLDCLEEKITQKSILIHNK